MKNLNEEINGKGTNSLSKIGLFFKSIWKSKQIGVLVALIVIVFIMSIFSDNFFSRANLLSVARQMTLVAIMGSGMTFLVISREFDLSVGSVFGLSGMVLALSVRNFGFNIWLGMLLSLLVGAFCGAFNGTMSIKLRIPSFIVTLGTLSVYRGLTMVLSNGMPIASIREASGSSGEKFYQIFSGRIFNLIPSQSVWMIGIFIIGAIILSRSSFGYRVFATGSNPDAAKISGINTDRVKIINFIITGVLTAFAGIVMIAMLDSASPLGGRGMELDIIAAVVIGGTAISGGIGSVFGTFLGAAIISTVRNGLVLVGISAYFQEMIIGFVILAAVILDSMIHRRRQI